MFTVTQSSAQNLLSLYTSDLYTFLPTYRTDVLTIWTADPVPETNKSLFSMEVAGGSMGGAVGLAGCPPPAAATAVAEDVPPEPEPAGLVVVLQSSAASFAAAGIAGFAAAAAVGQCVVVGAPVRHWGLLPLHGHMEGLAVAAPVPAAP